MSNKLYTSFLFLQV